MNVLNLKVGQTGIISHVEGNDKLTKRLLVLGCTNGTSIKLKRKAPLGDPIILNIRGFDIAIRKNDAKSIYLKEII
ncbi:ferrous iron transport protein A [uncultured Clostridium sp.]|jgi:ferrous iron transport protein A|uniref:FeoA family protein n=1 Tax=uncultured Clostridium sp. TaxID=59620 RepID=UPI002616462F|nr:ferrous iron transport protein A [uncultured Clostridium sp.]